MKLCGGIRPLSGCGQRSSASTPVTRPGGEIDLRLVVQQQRLLLDRLPQLLLQRLLRGDRLIQRGVEQRPAPALAAPRRLERQLGRAQQMLEAGAVVREQRGTGDARARRARSRRCRSGRPSALEHVRRPGGGRLLAPPAPRTSSAKRSPPMRATSVAAGHSAVRRRAIWRSTSSPTRVAVEAVDVAQPIDVEHDEQDQPPTPPRRLKPPSGELVQRRAGQQAGEPVPLRADGGRARGHADERSRAAASAREAPVARRQSASAATGGRSRAAASGRAPGSRPASSAESSEQHRRGQRLRIDAPASHGRNGQRQAAARIGAAEMAPARVQTARGAVRTATVRTAMAAGSDRRGPRAAPDRRCSSGFGSPVTGAPSCVAGTRSPDLANRFGTRCERHRSSISVLRGNRAAAQDVDVDVFD